MTADRRGGLPARAGAILARLAGRTGSPLAVILRGGALGFLFKLIGILLRFGATIALTRALGVTDYGVYAFVLVAVQLVTVPVVNGCRRVLVRSVAEAREHEDWAGLRALWRGAQVGLVLAMAGIGAASLWVVSWTDPDILAGAGPVLAWAALVPVLMTVLRYNEGLMRGLGHVAWAQFPVLVLRPLLFLLLVAGAWLALGPGRLDAGTAFVLMALAFGLAALPTLRQTARLMPAAVRGARADYRTGLWVRAAMPFVLVSGCQSVQDSAGVLMLGSLGGEAEVGLFHAANRLSEIVDLAFMAAVVAAEPVITRLYGAGDLAGLARLMTRLVRLVAVMSLALAAGAVLFSDPLIAVFGPGFAAAAPTFIVLVVMTAIVAVLGLADVVLAMTAHAGLVARVTLVSALLNLAFCFVLIPAYGAVGAAWALALALIPGKIYMLWRARRLLGIDASVLGWHRRSVLARG